MNDRKYVKTFEQFIEELDSSEADRVDEEKEAGQEDEWDSITE